MNSDDIREAVARYETVNFQLVRLKPGAKTPISKKGWQNAAPKASEFLPNENVGVQLGSKSGYLVDIDLDIPEARALAGLKCFFGHLPAFRRSSLPPDEPGHRLVVCRDAPDEVKQFGFTKQSELEAIKSLNLSKSVVLEIRAGKCFTVFPPSVIDGDPLVFNPAPVEAIQSSGDSIDIPEMSWEEVRGRAGLLAYVSFLAACYPPEGNRDNFCFHLAGSLIHLGLEAETAEDIVIAVAKLKGDQWSQRVGKARAAAEKHDAQEAVTGIPAFLDHLGMSACEARLRQWLGPRLQTTDNAIGPEGSIELGGTNLHRELLEIEKLLIEKSGRIFRRHAELVRVSHLEQAVKEDGIFRWAGLAELVPAIASWLTIEASRVGHFVKRKGTKYVPIPPSQSHLTMLQAIADESKFPVISGLSMTPTLSCATPGYDSESRLFLAFPEGMFPKPIARPSREDAEEALSKLLRPLRGFPFVDDAARSVVLSGMISAVIRGQLRTCPLHGLDAPAAGSGKTKLAEIIGIMATGVPPSGITYSSDTDENEKRLVSILRTGDPVVLIDNVTSDLEGDFLCSMLSNEMVQARILGQSERVHLGTRVLMVATGNNIRLRGDMARRAVVCRLDAKMPNPDERKFDFDAVSEVRANRPALVVDALTIVRAFIAAGRPGKLSPFGSFEDWDLVRGALVWLGLADPAETRAAVKDDNPLMEEKAEVLGAVLHRVGLDSRFTMKDVDTVPNLESLRNELKTHLRHGEWDKNAAGRLLRRHKDVPFKGVMLRSIANRLKVQEWWLEGEPEAELAETQKKEPDPF
jgi:hypothetical protein